MLTPLRITNLPGAKGPSLALDAQGTMHVAFGVENALYLASASAGDSAFTAPVKIAQAGRLALGMRRGPRLAVLGKTLVVSAIYGQQGGGRRVGGDGRPAGRPYRGKGIGYRAKGERRKY